MFLLLECSHRFQILNQIRKIYLNSHIYNRKILIDSKLTIKFLEKGEKSKVILYEMPEDRSIDIDSEFDFKLVEFLLKEKNE